MTEYQTGDYVRIHDHDGKEITVRIDDSGIPNRQGGFTFKAGARIFKNSEILGLGEVPVVSEKKWFEVGDQVVVDDRSRAVVVAVTPSARNEYLVEYFGGHQEDVSHGNLRHIGVGAIYDPARPWTPASDTEVHADLVAENEAVKHPAHYGGDTTYEVIKVIDAWGLGFALGNLTKYVARAGKKDPAKELEDLRKGRFYLDHRINQLETGK